MTLAIRTAHAAVVKVLDEHAAAVAYAQAEQQSGRWTIDGVAGHLDQQNVARRWTGRVDDAEHAVAAAIDDAEQHAARARAAAIGNPTGTATEQILAETRAVRAWERLRARLDRLTAAGTIPVLRAAFVAAEGDLRRIIAEELPEYVDARDIGLDIDSMIDDTLAADSTDYADAREALDDARRDGAAVRQAIAVVRSALGGEAVSPARADLQVRQAFAA